MNNTLGFNQLELSVTTLSALAKQGITDPTAIQLKAIPVVLSGRDAYICSETGSGKTLAYLLPVYSKLIVDKSATQLIVIAPTHELALQIHRVSCDLAQHAGLAVRNVLLIGGTSLDRQLEKLKKKPQIVIGSPGRVLEMIERGKLKVSELKTLVIDEADRLLAGDSLDKVQKIIHSCPGKRQLVFVSATEQEESAAIIEKISPELIRLSATETTINPNIKHYYVLCEERDKPDVLRKLIHATKTNKAIAFTHRNETAEIVAAKLLHHKVTVSDLHGAYEKEDRKLAMESFRNGKSIILLASDVAARGIDFSDITHVFNLDIPSQPKDYLHRVGRTARAGKQGVAISIVVEPEKRIIERLERELKIEIQEVELKEGRISLI